MKFSQSLLLAVALFVAPYSMIFSSEVQETSSNSGVLAMLATPFVRAKDVSLYVVDGVASCTINQVTKRILNDREGYFAIKNIDRSVVIFLTTAAALYYIYTKYYAEDEEGDNDTVFPNDIDMDDFQ